MKRLLPDRAIRALRAMRSTVEAQQWSSGLLAGPAADLLPLAYWPGGRQNPYLKLLYSRVPEVGYHASALVRYSDLDDLPSAAVFHLHWTRAAQLGATTKDDAARMAADYLAPIERFVERGGTFLWSVHEELPHDCPFPDVEVRMRSRLADLAHGIHVLHPSTVDAVAHLYELPPAKTFVVEHPLYDGYYPRFIGREAARRMLALTEDEALVLGFGAIRPYKGFDRLVDVADDVSAAIARPVRVVIAGPTMSHAEIGDLERKVASRSAASLSAGPVPEQDVQVLFEAADVVALPYRKVMNSGVLMLGLSFGKRCVAPDNAITRDAAASEMVHLFEADSDTSLTDALVDALNRRQADGLPQAFRHRYDPFSIAGEFAHQLANVVAGDVPGTHDTDDRIRP